MCHWEAAGGCGHRSICRANLVASVGGSTPYQKIVFRCDMEGQIALSFAAPLATNEHVGESAALTPETVEPSGDSCRHVRRLPHDVVSTTRSASASRETGGGFGR